MDVDETCIAQAIDALAADLYKKAHSYAIQAFNRFASSERMQACEYAAYAECAVDRALVRSGLHLRNDDFILQMYQQLMADVISYAAQRYT